MRNFMSVVFRLFKIVVLGTEKKVRFWEIDKKSLKNSKNSPRITEQILFF